VYAAVCAAVWATADDVADTAATLALVKDFCAGKAAAVRCAVLYEKPQSAVSCEYGWRRDVRWITVPWGADEPVEFDVAAGAVETAPPFR
jgi:hypoxanthine phosphoribosyltransferase